MRPLPLRTLIAGPFRSTHNDVRPHGAGRFKATGGVHEAVEDIRFVPCCARLLRDLGCSAGPGATAASTLSPGAGPAGTTGTLTAGATRVPFKTSASGYFPAALVMPDSTDPVVAVHVASGKISASASFTLTYSSPPLMRMIRLPRQCRWLPRHPWRRGGHLEVWGRNPGRTPRLAGALPRGGPRQQSTIGHPVL